LLPVCKTMIMANQKRKIISIAVLGLLAIRGYGQQLDEETLKTMVESKQFGFHVQTAIPSGGSSRQLTSDYDLKVYPERVVSYLPFFGRAYSLPYGSGQGGFEFTSAKFSYSYTPRKKGGWEIRVKPTDIPDFREFSLTVSAGGYGTLQAFSNNRQPISFTGYMVAAK
jgi:Domain of unknown function (DUF4251)